MGSFLEFLGMVVRFYRLVLSLRPAVGLGVEGGGKPSLDAEEG